MQAFNFIVSLACLFIMASSVWACFSDKVRDGLFVKATFGLTGITAYMAMSRPEERTFALLIVSMSTIALAVLFQRYIMKSNLWHHKAKATPCTSSPKISRSRNSQKAKGQRVSA